MAIDKKTGIVLAGAAVATGVALVVGYFMMKGGPNSETKGQTPPPRPRTEPPPPPVTGKLLPASGGRVIIATLADMKPVVDEVAKALPEHEIIGLYHPEEELAGLVPSYLSGDTPVANVFVLLDGFIDQLPETAALAMSTMLLTPKGQQMRLAVMPPSFGELGERQSAAWDRLNCKTAPCWGKFDLTLPKEVEWKGSPEATIASVAVALGQNIAGKIRDGVVVLLEEEPLGRCGARGEVLKEISPHALYQNSPEGFPSHGLRRS